jgi:tetratricopeptide (TPR) repeat protein
MKNFEKITNYLKGELKDGDLWEFRKALEVDAELAADYKLYTQAHAQLENKHKNKLHNTLNSIHKDAQRKGIVRSLGVYRLAGIAAAMALLIGFGTLMFNMFGTSSTQQLYAAYFQQEKSVLNVRSAGLNMEQTVMQGMQYYEMNKFEIAIAMFDMEPGNLLGKLYSGISYMELNDFEKAMGYFNFIIQHKDNLFIDQSEWYLSLCYLKTNRMEEASRLLDKIANERGVFKTKAQMLLNELKNK